MLIHANEQKTHSDSQMYVYTQKIIQEPIHFKLGDKTSICIYNKYADDHIIYLFKKKKPLHSEQTTALWPTSSKIQMILIIVKAKGSFKKYWSQNALSHSIEAHINVTVSTMPKPPDLEQDTEDVSSTELWSLYFTFTLCCVLFRAQT